MLVAQITDTHILAPGSLFKAPVAGPPSGHERVLAEIDTAACLARAVAALNALDPQPDVTVVTGDLCDHGEIVEYEHLRQLLAPLRMPVFLIPGNHDAYVESVVKERTFERLFAAYQTSDLATDLPPHLATDLAPNLARRDDAVYPFVHLRDEVALIGVSSSVATGDLGAWGQVGTAQLERLEAILRSPELTGKTRVVLIHHPPVLHKAGEHRNLRDREAFAAVLARAGAELVLHGHDHEDQRAQLPGPDGRPIPIIGAGSASYAGGPERRSRYSLYEIEGGAITWTSRVHDEASDTFHERRRERL